MATTQRVFDRGKRRGMRLIRFLGTELRDARLGLGLSQRTVAHATRMAHSKVSRVENGQLQSLSIMDAAVLAAAVGLDLSAKTYPGGSPIRDNAQATKLGRLLSHAARPLRRLTEVLLPPRDDAPEQRSWDATINDKDEKMGVEVEMKLYDAQAQTRRIQLKWQDSGLERLLVVVADTKSNRRVLREYPDYFAQWPRLRTHDVINALEAGILPPTGLILY